MKQKQTFAVIVGNRGFFPAHLVKTGHEQIKALLEGAGYKTVMLSFDDTKFGSVESLEDAKKCAALFKARKDDISGVIVTLPNFGDERAIANTLRWSGLDVPVLIQAEPDDASKMTPADRRDSFCGKVSACNVMRQYGIRYSLTTYHTESVRSEEFKADLETFAAICRVVKAMRGARFGAIGARTAPFFTVRYSEKILEAHGITVEAVDLSEILGAANKVKSSDKEFKERLKAAKSYAECPGVTQEGFERMARFSVAVDRWMKANELVGSAIQCWTAIEELYGIVPCQVMSMMSNTGLSSACEVDMGGTIAMHALWAASGKPSRACRLEQQLRRRPRQVRRLPLLEPPEGRPVVPEGLLPGDYRRDSRREERVRFRAGQGQARRGDLRARIDRRHPRHHPRLRRRGRVYRRPSRDLRRLRRPRSARSPDTYAVHLRGRLRAPLRHQPLQRRRRRHRGLRQVPRLGRLSPLLSAADH